MILPAIMIGSALIVMGMYFRLSYKYKKTLELLEVLDILLESMDNEINKQQQKIKSLEAQKNEKY